MARMAGVVGLFVGKPHHPVGPDGRMALSDHLRELRARILKVALTVVVALAVALLFFDQLFDLVYGPYIKALESLPGVGRKTAGVVLLHLGAGEAFPVDTHVGRVARRLGLTRQRDPGKVEDALCRHVPRELWGRGHQLPTARRRPPPRW